MTNRMFFFGTNFLFLVSDIVMNTFNGIMLYVL